MCAMQQSTNDSNSAIGGRPVACMIDCRVFLSLCHNHLCLSLSLPLFVAHLLLSNLLLNKVIPFLTAVVTKVISFVGRHLVVLPVAATPSKDVHGPSLRCWLLRKSSNTTKETDIVPTENGLRTDGRPRRKRRKKQRNEIPVSPQNETHNNVITHETKTHTHQRQIDKYSSKRTNTFLISENTTTHANRRQIVTNCKRKATTKRETDNSLDTGV